MVSDHARASVESSTTIGSPERYDSHCVVSAWEHRLRRSPTSRTLATSRCQSRGTSISRFGSLATMASAYGSCSSKKSQARVTDPSRTNRSGGGRVVVATPRTRETGSCTNLSVTVPLVSDVPKRRTAEAALDPVPVSEHLSADSGRVPLVIGFKWDEHGHRLAPVGDDDPLPLGHPLEELCEMRLRFERADARHNPPYKLVNQARLLGSRAGLQPSTETGTQLESRTSCVPVSRPPSVNRQPVRLNTLLLWVSNHDRSRTVACLADHADRAISIRQHTLSYRLRSAWRETSSRQSLEGLSMSMASFDYPLRGGVIRPSAGRSARARRDALPRRPEQSHRFPAAGRSRHTWLRLHPGRSAPLHRPVGT